MNPRDIMGISPIVPVIALERAEDALPLADALMEGGIFIMEITLRTDAGLAAIAAIASERPQMHVGAGTVLNRASFAQAVEHGAQFVFSPGISEELMEASRELNIPFIPGVATASEVMMASNGGFDQCKLFPATVAGGIEALKAFAGPFGSMQFCPTGGVNVENFTDFLKLGNVLCVGGSWIVPKDAIAQKNFHTITQLCKEAFEQLR
jgi:2-dehydro-3-deoxyphosphogluconate aldolase/(4S)-4-hydroxy-2-oxoglutarate aldolase